MPLPRIGFVTASHRTIQFLFYFTLAYRPGTGFTK
jgi:hypothetical protein